MSTEPFKQIGVEEANDLIKQGARVVDVRQPYEFNHDHIEGSILVPIDGLYSFFQALNKHKIPKDLPILFVCEMGQRSSAASEVAAIAGYTRVYNLMGGMNLWRYQGQPVERGSR